MAQLGLETRFLNLSPQLFNLIMLSVSLHTPMFPFVFVFLLTQRKKRKEGGREESEKGGRVTEKKAKEKREEDNFFFMDLECFLLSIDDPHRGLRKLFSQFPMANLLLIPL